MRGKHCLHLSLSIGALILLPLCARADSLLLGLSQTSTVDTLLANTTLSQDVQASTDSTLDGMAFYLSDPSGAPITYSISDLTTSSTLFSETFDDTTLDPLLTSIAIPEGSKAWLELYLPPTLLPAGSDTYQFSVSGAGSLKVGIDPTSNLEDGLEPVGGSTLGLRLWGSSAATPEPDALVLLGAGAAFLSLAAIKRKPWMK